MAISKIETADYTVPRGKVLYQDGNVYNSKFRELGVASELNITEETEVLEHKDTSIGGNLVDKKVITSIKATGTMILDLPNILNLNLFFLGEGATERTQASGTGGAAADLVAGLDLWVPIVDGGYRQRKISNVIVKDVTDTTTYVEGTDYEVDLEHGFLRVFSGLTIAEDAILHLTIDKEETDINTVLGAVNGQIEGHFMYLGDPVTGYRQEVEGLINLIPNGDLSLIIENDWQRAPFTIEFISHVQYRNSTGNGLFKYHEYDIKSA